MFNIYVDADSLPKSHRTIILRRVLKESDEIGECVFASDRILPDVRDTIEGHTFTLREPLRGILDKSELRKVKSNIRLSVVETGPNSADNYLVENAVIPAFAVTHDIPLASRLVEKGLTVIDDRGNVFTKDNIGQRLSERNFMTELREAGFESDKSKPFDSRTLNAFSNSFDSVFSLFLKNNSKA